MITDLSPIEIIRSHQIAAPVPVLDIARDFGLRVYRAEWENGASGCIRKDRKRGGKSGFAIFTNKAHGRTRRRFTIAHEIGHFVLHRNKIGKQIVDNRLYQSRLDGTLEVQAHEFAAFILMPWDLVVQEVKSGADSVEALARRFEVSKSAMSIRLRFPYETE